MSRAFCVAVVLSVTLVIPGAPAAGEGRRDSTLPNDDVVHLDGVADTTNATFDFLGGWGKNGAGRPPRAPGVELKVHVQDRPICFTGDGDEEPANVQGWCPSGIPQAPVLTCDGETFTSPTWRQLEFSDGTLTEWQRLDQGVCGPVLPVLTVEDFRSLPIPAPVLRLQPEGDWVLVNIATIVMTDPAPVVLRTTLGGYGVDVEARPVLFTYDFGDGHDLVTRSPGAPYPDHDTFHEYEAPGTYAVTLTTEWAGRFRVDGDPTWREVTGTVSTSTTSPEFEAQERTSRLVSGLCTDRPKPPDC